MTGSASVTILLNLCMRVQQILHQKTTRLKWEVKGTQVKSNSISIGLKILKVCVDWPAKGGQHVLFTSEFSIRSRVVF